MKLLSVTFLLMLFVVGCGGDGLGMNIEIKEKDAPVKLQKAVAEARTGKLKIAIVNSSAPKSSQELAAALAKAFGSDDAPDGVLTFTKLAVRNRSMQHPPRASAEIDATCVWHETGEDATSFDITVRTFSIEINDWNKQPAELRNEALKGMANKLVREF